MNQLFTRQPLFRGTLLWTLMLLCGLAAAPKAQAAIVKHVSESQSTDAQTDYYRALTVIQDAHGYRVFTMYGGKKYYITAKGKLSTSVAEAPLFIFKKVDGKVNGEYDFGFQLPYKGNCFSNPEECNESALTNGQLHTTIDSRDTWEAQVFFLNTDGKYAIRSTNCKYSADHSSWNWIGSAFWTVNSGADGPLAEYSFDMNYVWEIEEDIVYHDYITTAGTEGTCDIEDYPELVDGNKYTKWCVSPLDNPTYIEFLTSAPIIPTGYVLTTGGDNEKFQGRNPKSWTIKAKANFSDDWTTLATVTNDNTLQDKNTTDYAFTIANDQAYQYFRFEVSAVKGNENVLQLSEFAFVCDNGATPTIPAVVVTIDETNFPDERFRNYVHNYIDTNKDQCITADEVTKGTNLGLYSAFVFDLTGIEHFTEARTLICDYNRLTTLDVSNQTKLFQLTCSYNQLTSLDLSQNTALEELDCSRNQLTTLKVSPNSILNKIDCSSNKIAGTKMDELVKSLPVTTNGLFTVLDSTDVNEQNVITKAQVAAAKAKGWTVRRKGNVQNGEPEYVEYEGSEPAAHVHDMVLVIGKEATCTEPGTAGYWGCSTCDKMFSDEEGQYEISAPEEIPALGHDWSEWEVTRVPTATVPGEETRHCQRDESHIETRPIPVIGGGIAIDETNFPDDAFRQYVLDNCDTNGDKVLSDEEIANATHLYVDGLNIADLTGVGHFTALQHLDCYDNQLTALDVSKNAALQWLNCANNQLTTLDVTKNTALKTLDCSWNSLSSLNVSKNTALMALLSYYNQLTTLDVSQNTELKSLVCEGNELTALDVTKNTALETLDCALNNLSSLDLSQNQALEQLDCSDNQLTAIDLSHSPELELLLCYRNKLTSLDVSHNPTLYEIFLHRNQIKGAEMDALVTSLQEVQNSKETFLAVVDATDAKEGNVMTPAQVEAAKAKGWTIYYYKDDDEEWTEYEGGEAVVHVHMLKYVNGKEATCTEPGTVGYWRCSTCEKMYSDMEGEYEISAPEEIPALGHNWGDWVVIREATATEVGEERRTCHRDESHIETRYTAIFVVNGIFVDETNFPDEKFRNFLLEQDYGQDGILTESEIANCTKMEAIFLEAASLKGIEYFTALKELRCYGNNLTELDLSQNTALETLICHNTPLTSLDLSKNTALKELDLTNDQLTSLDLSQNTALRVLEISGNPLTAIDLSNNTALTELHCKRNQLTTLDVSKNTALMMIECSDNQLTEIDITKNTLLMVLACSNNLIHNINVSPDCTMLRAIDCRHNQLKGASVDMLIENLPTRDADELAMIGFRVDDNDEANVMTPEQVAAANEKNWQVVYWPEGASEDDYVPYPGTATHILSLESSEPDVTASWYTLDGVKLSGKPTRKGLYLLNGRVVVIKCKHPLKYTLQQL